MKKGHRPIRIIAEMFDNPLFGERRLTWREAYLWLCVHSPVKASGRQLARRWQWGSSAAHRFLRTLIAHGLVYEVDGVVTVVQWKAVTQRIDITGAAWARLRQQVFARDGFRCVYCGGAENLECDHVQPVVEGGPTTMGNLATACEGCNSRKGPLSLEDWRKRKSAS
jgi:hypothetical protein